MIQDKPDFDTLKLIFEIARKTFITKQGKDLIYMF